MSEGFGLESFRRHLDTLFQVESGEGQQVDVALVEAQELRAPPSYEAFSLVFRGPLDGFLPQAVYRFHHEAMDTCDIFIVPFRQDAQGFYYEAIFNRLRAEEQG